MNKEQSKEQVTSIKTTIGELIEAVTEIALEAGKSEAEGYRLASLTLESILRRRLREFPLYN